MIFFLNSIPYSFLFRTLSKNNKFYTVQIFKSFRGIDNDVDILSASQITRIDDAKFRRIDSEFVKKTIIAVRDISHHVGIDPVIYGFNLARRNVLVQ